MTVLDMYFDFRCRFSEVTQKADQAHLKLWGDLDPEYAHSWFESVAKAINIEMNKGASSAHYVDVFKYFETQYKCGIDEVKDCIDVSFTENLFWQVSAVNAQGYWQVLPELLKTLYIDFHANLSIYNS
ncbi:hypothetical protein J8M21_24760 [Pseudoalteromonas luteoviolacea]|uniref:DUF7674 family protein n=1 Tax=Pseudoalteromonas luteoviolacea TaxID=43657 RepID=UPI001B3A315C|nr:hypothetical protein [Pseudoalteromonas luteoviolacea]MBQ4880415.1 hypothetical protein [Pseudoalteromonas luteoviolacea]MBQ4909476.1 hypothetical protein [Pseudoalteromonas luteoviolacea]